MMKILISDDSLTVRKVIEMLLKPLDYVLVFSETGKDTISKVMSEQIDLAIIDYSLPDMVGTQVTKEIKKINPMISTLLMISNKEHEPSSKLQEGMCDDLIEKPFDSQTFLNKVDALLKKPAVELTAKPAMGEELISDKSVLEDINIDIGEEFVSPHTSNEMELEEELKIPSLEEVTEIQEESLEEIEEIEEVEEIEKLGEKVDQVLSGIQEEPEVENVEEITIDELLKEDMGNLSMVDSETKVIELSDIIEDKEKLEKKEEKVVVEEEKTFIEEEKSINLDDFFSDLNEILSEDKKEKQAVSEKEMVVPVIEEVAKELKELEMITEEVKEKSEHVIGLQEEKEVKEEIEEDIWNFDLDISKKPVSASDVVTPQKIDSKEIENIVREITYDIVEKIAWEIVPEIVDTIMKDKLSKKS